MIEIALEGEIEKPLENMQEEIQFHTQGRQYGAVEVRFVTEKTVVAHGTATLKADDQALLPTYLGRRIVRLRIGKIPQEIEEEWLVTVILSEVKEDMKVILGNKDTTVGWWGYGLELFLHITERDFKKLPEVIELPENVRLNIVIKRAHQKNMPL